MKTRSSRILESKDLQLYKRLLNVLGDYSMNVPMTGIDRLFDVVVESGAKVMPKDKNAIEILKWLLDCNSSAATVHKILNLRFSDLPVEIRPIIKSGRKHEVAFWTRDEITSDRVKDLIDWSGGGKAGIWTDVDGQKQEVIDASVAEEEK